MVVVPISLGIAEVVGDVGIGAIDDLPATEVCSRDIQKSRRRRASDREIDLARAAELEVSEAARRPARCIGEVELDRGRAAASVQRAGEIKTALRICAGEAGAAHY